MSDFLRRFRSALSRHRNRKGNHDSDSVPLAQRPSAVMPRIWVSSLTFSGGMTIPFDRNDVIVLVGPNNAGKSATLRYIRDRTTDVSALSPVVTALDLRKEGSIVDLREWLEAVSRKHVDTTGVSYTAYGNKVYDFRLQTLWGSSTSELGPLTRFFCQMLTADERLQVANPAPAIALTQEAPNHPIHDVYRNDSLEAHLSTQFRAAFGVDLIVHRAAGSSIPLYAGERPKPQAGEDRVSMGYVNELEKLPELRLQGDGMRSFAGVLLNTSVGRESVLLIDEPEAFLHPPQARLLGRVLVQDKRAGRQLFVATHSGDVLRGMLDANVTNLRIVRVQRRDDATLAHELNTADIASYWSDPLLRYSNILDGIFHEKVVVCESDSDTRFYGAVLDAVHELKGPEAHRSDVMLAHCGGKQRLPMAVRALRRLGVPVVAVADIDILNDEYPLRDVAAALGIGWAEIAADFRIVKGSVDKTKPELGADDVRTEIARILAGVSSKDFPAAAKREIESLFRRTSPWAIVKRAGVSAIASGDATQALRRLLTSLRRAGLFVVEVGEVERFVPSVGNHGPAWVNEALRRNLRTDPELAEARTFVTSILDWTPGP